MQQSVKYIENVHGRSQGYITRAFIPVKSQELLYFYTKIYLQKQFPILIFTYLMN